MVVKLCWHSSYCLFRSDYELFVQHKCMEARGSLTCRRQIFTAYFYRGNLSVNSVKFGSSVNFLSVIFPQIKSSAAVKQKKAKSFYQNISTFRTCISSSFHHTYVRKQTTPECNEHPTTTMSSKTLETNLPRTTLEAETRSP